MVQRVGPPRARVTDGRRVMMELLLQRDGEWVTAAEVARAGGLSIGGAHATLTDLIELGWVELQVDAGRERRVGAVGRKPRRACRVTALGKTALIENAMEEL